MKNGIQDLRNHLFETIEQLKDPDKPMDLERAKAVCNVAKTIIESAKVEVKAMEVNAEIQASGFFREAPLPGGHQLPASKPNGKMAA